MGGHVGTRQATKKRRLHLIRRIARLILGAQKQSRKKQEADEERICRGPSIFQNLLPFLEPLITIDPKLRFIEDHIIGRIQPPNYEGSVKLPSSLDELQAWVKEAALPCKCDECTPKSYRLESESSHSHIWHAKGGQRIQSPNFSHVVATHTTPHPTLSLRLYGDYEAMRLTKHHIAWLDYAYLHPSRLQDAANVSQLMSLLHVWKPSLVAPDLQSHMSMAQLRHLFRQLNDVFFFSAVPQHRQSLSAGFSWLAKNRKDCFGISYYNPIIGTQLLLHPTLYRDNNKPDDLGVRLRNRIGTILHEMCHAFLKAYTCRSCIMHEHCVGPRGHGRAWQILAAKVEEVASRLMGGRVDMGRFPSLLHDMDSHGRLPSQHDLELYKFAAVTTYTNE